MTTIKRTRNTVKKEILTEIPETVQGRRLFLNKEMLKYIGSTINCPALDISRSTINRHVFALFGHNTIKTSRMEVVHSCFSRCFYVKL